MIRLLSSLLAFAAVLENTGAPLRVPFTCSAGDLEDAGLTCTDEQPCAVYLELSGVESVLGRIFLAGNIHTADATLYSILLASEDGGATWTEPFQRIRFNSLDQIQFIDFETGWVAGANVQGVPRDPFLLVTGDGGKTWKPAPLFDESRTGVIERFRFDSKASGRLLLSTKLRHELYETRTGGENWALRQFSKDPIAFPGEKAAADASIRIRPDAKIHGYRVEKRQGEKWVEASSFLVDLAKCKN